MQELSVPFDVNRIVSNGDRIFASDFEGNHCAIWAPECGSTRIIDTNVFGLRASTDEALIGVKLGTYCAVIRPLDSADEIILVCQAQTPLSAGINLHRLVAGGTRRECRS